MSAAPMKIYVAYLATDGGRDALTLGVMLARSLGAELAVGMVVPPDTGAALTAGDFEEVITDAADDWLADARHLIPDDVAVSTHIGIYDSTTEGIIAEAERVGAALIVAGGSGGGLLANFTLGSVVNGLIHSAPLPLALAPRGTRESSVTSVRSITAALGTGPGADELLDVAVAGCQRAHVPLRLVSLVALDLMPSRRRADPDALAEAAAHAQELLDNARARLPETVAVESVVATGPSVEEAVSGLDWQPGDVIVAGSSRLAAPRRLFLGSTAAKMMRVLAVPMIVVPREM
ncbi:universal stress protein [Mycolicibacterium insubricum]|nr:universal stress protein [Mycolicibacterium insubricum]